MSNSYTAKELADKIEQEGICWACDYPDWYGRKDMKIDPPTANAERDLIVKALRALDVPKYEIVAYVVRSRRDGSFFDRIAPIKYIEFKDRLDELRAEPWVVNGAADIVPLYELRECATHGEGVK